MAVVSLFPSATEILAALDVIPDAVSHQCDRPPEAAAQPTLTGLVRDLDADPETIDRIVAYDDVYFLDGDVLAAVDPDIVVTQGVCGVCALDAGLARCGIERLDIDATLLDVHATDLEDVLTNVEQIGDAVGRTNAARRLRTDLEDRIADVQQRIPAGRGQSVRDQRDQAHTDQAHTDQAHTDQAHSHRTSTTRAAQPASHGVEPERPRVAVLDWTDPIRHGGLWTPELIELAGGDAELVAPGARSRRIDVPELRAVDPDAIVVAPCGYDVDDAHDAARSLLERTDLDELAAVQHGHVYAADGAAYFNRHSHRVVDTLELLAAILHPDRFDSLPDDRVRRLSIADEPSTAAGLTARRSRPGREG